MKYTPVGCRSVLGAGRSAGSGPPLEVHPWTTDPLGQQSSSTSLDAARQDWSIRSRNSADGRAGQVVRVGVPGQEVQLPVGFAELAVPAEVEQRRLAGLLFLEEQLDGVRHFGAGRLGDHRAVVVHADLGALQHGPHVVQVGPDGRRSW